MKMLCLPAFGRKRRHGFTIAELAIIVGIIGGVLAALFATASIARYRLNINQGSDELQLTLNNVRNLYAGRNVAFNALNAARPLNPAPTPGDFGFYNPLMLQAQVFPREMIANGVANNVWNPSNAGGTAQVALAYPNANNPVQIVVRYTNLPTEVCTDLLMRNSMPGNQTGLTRIAINAPAAVYIQDPVTNTQQLPVTAVNAAAACDGAANYTIDWYYNIR
jgi:hypothetical protein